MTVLARTVFDDVLVTEHEDDASVLDAEPVVQHLEILAERLLVVASAERYLKHLQHTTTHAPSTALPVVCL